MTNEFTSEPFPIALADVMGHHSQRQFAQRVHLSQSTLSRLLSGAAKPDMATMETIAVAMGLDPWYFIEWRTQFIIGLLGVILAEYPNIGITAVKALRRNQC